MEQIREGMSGKRVADIISSNFKYLDDKINNGLTTNHTELLNRVTQLEQYVIDTTKNQVVSADNEDTHVVAGALKLADRKYEGDGFSGKGFKILRQRLYALNTTNCPFNEMDTNCNECCDCCSNCINSSIVPNKYVRNVLLQKDFNHNHTIFVVRYDFDLNGQDIMLLSDCEIRFEGGTFKNGSIDLNQAKVHGMIGDYTDYFINVTVNHPHPAQESIFKI